MTDIIDEMNEDTRRMNAEARQIMAKQNLRHVQQPWRSSMPPIIAAVAGAATVLLLLALMI